MRRDELEELHCITPIGNVASILEHGILSNMRAEKLPHTSVAMPEMQDLRRKVIVPGGRPLHQYANLYLCGRNPMMSKRRDSHSELCVLRVRPDVLDLPNVVITDQNAGSRYVRFAASPSGLSIVNRAMVFAEFWTHPDDQKMQWRHSSIKCAEVLIPDRIAPQFVIGVYVSGETGRARIAEVASSLSVVINPHMFFQ